MNALFKSNTNYFSFLYFFMFLLIFSCSSKNINKCTNVQKTENSAISHTQNENMDKLVHNVIVNAATIYYDIKKKPIIKIHIKDPSSNFSEGLPLAYYFYDNLKTTILNKSQFKIVPLSNFDTDCVVETHIVKKNNDIKLLNFIIDSKQNVIQHSLTNSYNIIANSTEYIAFKKKLLNKDVKLLIKENTTHLVVKAVNIGEQQAAFRTKTKTYSSETASDNDIDSKGNFNLNAKSSSRRYKAKGKYQGSYGNKAKRDYSKVTKSTENIGKNAIYPANQICYINGKKFSLGVNDIFYDGHIKSGELIFNIFFQEGIWKAEKKERYYSYWNRDKKNSTGTQILGKTHQKKFHYTIKPGDNIKIELIFTATSINKNINMKLYKEQSIKNGPFVEKYYEEITR